MLTIKDARDTSRYAIVALDTDEILSFHDNLIDAQYAEKRLRRTVYFVSVAHLADTGCSLAFLPFVSEQKEDEDEFPW